MYSRRAVPACSSLACAACPNVAGYGVTADANHVGDNLSLGSSSPNMADRIALTAVRCTDDSACLGFSSDGYYKSRVTPAQTAYGMCLYAKTGTVQGMCGMCFGPS